jgi:hypothetical protein
MKTLTLAILVILHPQPPVSASAPAQDIPDTCVSLLLATSADRCQTGIITGCGLESSVAMMGTSNGE